MPLTKEQFIKLRHEGLSTEQIIEFEKIIAQKQTPPQTAPSPKIASLPFQQNVPFSQAHPILSGIGKLGSETLGSAAKGINWAYGKFSQAPGVKQASELVGKGVGTAGYAIGGTIGALGETALQTKRAIQGEGFDIGRIGQTAKETALSTSAFGKNIGEQAVPAALTGGMGKYAQIALGASQGMAGYEEIKNSGITDYLSALKTGDKAQIEQAAKKVDWAMLEEGAIASATALLAAKGGKEGFKTGKEGIFIDPNVKRQIKSEISFLKNKSGVTPLEAAKKKGGEIYRKILQPTKGEIKNMEIRGGKDLDKIYTQMAEEGLPIRKSVDNKLDTTEAMVVIQNKMEPINKRLQEKLASRPQVSHSLFDLEERAMEIIDKGPGDALEQEERKDIAKKLIRSEIKKRFGDKPDFVPNVDNVEYNKIKQRWWSRGYDAEKPLANKVARQLGHMIKEDLEKRNPDLPIKEENQKLGRYADMLSLLENAHGRGIRGGRMGNLIARLGGAMVGSVAFPGGFLGHILGSIIGEEAAGGAREYLSDPSRLAKVASQSIEEARNVPPSLLKKATEKYIPGMKK